MRPAAPLVLAALMVAAGGVATRPTPLVAQDPVFAPALQVDLAAMKRSRGTWWRDITEGSGALVREGSRVTIHYTGWLADGTRFESSRESGETVSFAIGDGRVIRGWDDGLRGMRVGGVRQLVIPPRSGYGGRGRPPVIPPDAMLVFEVELVRIEGRN